jgi:anti-sigma factor RsiW
MNCKVMEKHSIAYMEGTAAPRLRQQIEDHLVGCRACRERARQFRQIWGVLEDAPVIRPSAGFDAAVRARIAQEGARRGPWSWFVAPSPRLAVGVTALLVFSVWLSSLPPGGYSPVPVSSAGDAEFKMIANLPVLEDYDVLANFEVLSELPVESATTTQPGF